MAYDKLIFRCSKFFLFFSRARRNFVPYLFFNLKLFIMADSKLPFGDKHDPSLIVSQSGSKYESFTKSYDNEIDVEGPSVIYLPQKNCYFNGFQTADTVKGYMLDTGRAIVFRGTELGINARNSVYELLKIQNESPLIVELIIP